MSEPDPTTRDAARAQQIARDYCWPNPHHRRLTRAIQRALATP